MIALPIAVTLGLLTFLWIEYQSGESSAYDLWLQESEDEDV